MLIYISIHSICISNTIGHFCYLIYRRMDIIRMDFYWEFHWTTIDLDVNAMRGVASMVVCEDGGTTCWFVQVVWASGGLPRAILPRTPSPRPHAYWGQLHWLVNTGHVIPEWLVIGIGTWNNQWNGFDYEILTVSFLHWSDVTNYRV